MCLDVDTHGLPAWTRVLVVDAPCTITKYHLYSHIRVHYGRGKESTSQALLLCFTLIEEMQVAQVTMSLNSTKTMYNHYEGI